MSLKKNKETIPLSILYVPYNAEQIRYSCKSECNLKRENQIIPL